MYKVIKLGLFCWGIFLIPFVHGSLDTEHDLALKEVLELLESSSCNQRTGFLNPPSGIDPLVVYRKWHASLIKAKKQGVLEPQNHYDGWGKYILGLLRAYEEPIKKHSSKEYDKVYSSVKKLLEEQNTNYKFFLEENFPLSFLVVPEKERSICEVRDPLNIFISHIFFLEKNKNWEDPKKNSKNYFVNKIGNFLFSYGALFRHFGDVFAPFYPFVLTDEEILSVNLNSGPTFFPLGWSFFESVSFDGIVARGSYFPPHDFSHLGRSLFQKIHLRITLKEGQPCPDFSNQENLKYFWTWIKDGIEISNFLTEKFQAAAKRIPEDEKDLFIKILNHPLHERVHDGFSLVLNFMKDYAIEDYLEKELPERIFSKSERSKKEIAKEILKYLNFSKEDSDKIFGHFLKYFKNIDYGDEKSTLKVLDEKKGEEDFLCGHTTSALFGISFPRCSYRRGKGLISNKWCFSSYKDTKPFIEECILTSPESKRNYSDYWDEIYKGDRFIVLYYDVFPNSELPDFELPQAIQIYTGASQYEEGANFSKLGEKVRGAVANLLKCPEDQVGYDTYLMS